MNTPTNTTTMNQNSAFRLAGNGVSSTGGWLAPPDSRRTKPTSRDHTNQGSAAASAMD